MNTREDQISSSIMYGRRYRTVSLGRAAIGACIRRISYDVKLVISFISETDQQLMTIVPVA
jgi:hypothetical protein